MNTFREDAPAKESRAGIAVSCSASGNNLLSLTLVTGPPNNGAFADPIEHELQGHTHTTLGTELSRILTTPTSIALSLSVGLPDEERKQYRDVVRQIPGMELWYTMDHSTAYLNHIIKEFKHVEEVTVVFLDLTTPGQVAGKLSTVETDDGKPVFFSEGRATAGTAVEVIDKLVTPTVTQPLHLIYILCPPGDLGLGCEAVPSTLKSKFPETIIRLVTLAEVSRGAAASRERHQGVITHQ